MNMIPRLTIRDMADAECVVAALTFAAHCTEAKIAELNMAQMLDPRARDLLIDGSAHLVELQSLLKVANEILDNHRQLFADHLNDTVAKLPTEHKASDPTLN